MTNADVLYLYIWKATMGEEASDHHQQNSCQTNQNYRKNSVNARTSNRLDRVPGRDAIKNSQNCKSIDLSA